MIGRAPGFSVRLLVGSFQDRSSRLAYVTELADARPDIDYRRSSAYASPLAGIALPLVGAGTFARVFIEHIPLRLYLQINRHDAKILVYAHAGPDGGG